MAVSQNTLRVEKIAYWLVTASALLYTCYWLMTHNRAIAGIIFLVIGGILVYIMYSVWFPPGDPGTQWPPYISACPDYLTVLAPNACADFVGLGSPMLKKSDPSNPPVPTDSAYVFDSSGTVQQKAARAQQYGLSWEGIL